jgi:hypothetical protein
MPQSKSTGTQVAVISTEHTLIDTADPGTYVLTVDCNAMIAGDTLQLRTYTKALSGGTYRQDSFLTFSGDQDDTTLLLSTIKVTDPRPAVFGFKATLRQSAGTGRSFPWGIVAL